MPIKAVTEERAETWKANERREIRIKKKGNARISEFFYLMNIFMIGIDLMNGYYLLVAVNFIGAVSGRFGMFKELRGCNL